MSLNPFSQNSAGILQPLPSGLTPLPGPYSVQYFHRDIGYDYAIGGIPFLAGESLRGTYFRRQYQRSFSPIRKDQFDNQQVPGEQSIWGWWLRSQSNFIQGAGAQFLDTTTDTSLSQRYSYSEGVDTLSTPGQVTLLPQVQGLFTGVGPMKLRTISSTQAPTFTDSVLVLDVGAKTLTSVSYGSLNATYTMPGGLTGLSNTLTDDGTNYYFADKTGIFKGAINSTSAAVKIWNTTGTVNVVLGWIKGRLVAGIDNSVYELVGAGPGLPTARFTHQNSSYTFSDFGELQSSIIVSGSAGGTVSQVHKFTLDNQGALPVLTSGVVTAQMPYGETILAMYAYLGLFIGIGTNKGFRVAVSDTNGNLAYGPLIVQDPSNVGVRAIGGYDRFLFIGNQGNTMVPSANWANPPEATVTDMLIRIDLSQQTSTGAQPFANDLMSPIPPIGGAVNSITNIGTVGTVGLGVPAGTPLLAWAVGQQVFAARNNGSKQPTGFLYTPKIRYNTLEPKHFKYVYMRHQNITDGSIDIFAQNPGMVLTSLAIGVSGSSSNGSSVPFFISDVGTAQEWLQFKFVLHRGISSNVGPVWNGYQLRALPGVSRQVILEIPLICHDHETDRYGTMSGTDGFAWERLNALESLTASGNLVLLQDLNYNTSNLVIVDDYKFEQQSPEMGKASSTGAQNSNVHGGYIVLRCRVIV